MSLHIKICGITSDEAANTAASAGADYLGFIHFAKSPRHLEAAEMAAIVKTLDTHNLKTVLVTADMDDRALLDLMEIFQPDMLQLHGKETPARVRQIATQTALPIIKAVKVASADDLRHAMEYADSVDYLLLDAPPPEGSDLPGGNGVSFDWSLLDQLDAGTEYFLSGGLKPENVAGAVRQFSPFGVDVSSGVEAVPGVKDPEKIRSFIRNAKAVSL